MAMVTKYLFSLGANDYVLAGTILTFDDADPEPHYPSEYTHEGDINVWNNQHLAHWDATTSAFIIDAPDPTEQLQAAINAKITEIQTAVNNAMETFNSSALNTVHTYQTGYGKGNTDFLMLQSEDKYMQGPDWDGKPILWYTTDAGDIEHSKDQIHRLWLDGRAAGQANKYKAKTKITQAYACTDPAQVQTIAWDNPNPPAIPSGLSGTAGAAGSGQVTLTWTANSDVTMIGGGGYNVYVDGLKANAALVTGATYAATGLSVGAHTFTITAVDTDGNESAQCAPVTVTVA